MSQPILEESGWTDDGMHRRLVLWPGLPPEVEEAARAFLDAAKFRGIHVEVQAWDMKGTTAWQTYCDNP